MSFSSVDTQSNLLSEISIVDYGERLESVDFEAELETEIFKELKTEIFEEILFFDKFKFKNDLEIEDLKKPEFPNEAYKDLMLLVTDHKILISFIRKFRFFKIFKNLNFLMKLIRI